MYADIDKLFDGSLCMLILDKVYMYADRDVHFDGSFEVC